MLLSENKVLSSTEVILNFKIAQLEGKLSLYEALTSEISKIEIVQQIALDARHKMEEILKVRSKGAA